MRAHYFYSSVFICLVSIWNISFAQNADFRKIKVINGPTIEYPAHWKILDDATVLNQVHSSQASADAAGINLDGFIRRNRVVIHSLPIPNKASVRASIVTPTQYSQLELSKINRKDLINLKKDYELHFREMSAVSAVRLQHMEELRVESIGGKLALVIPYIRYTESSSALWHVEQIKVPFEDRMLSLTLSYQISDAGTMKPILSRIKSSVKF